MANTVTIPLERLKELLDEERFVNCLRGAGVDNWEGYGFALDEYTEVTEADAIAEAAKYEPKPEADEKDF
jgi:hypothetical protein